MKILSYKHISQLENFVCDFTAEFVHIKNFTTPVSVPLAIHIHMSLMVPAVLGESLY